MLAVNVSDKVSVKISRTVTIQPGEAANISEFLPRAENAFRMLVDRGIIELRELPKPKPAAKPKRKRKPKKVKVDA